ncbi:zeta toxin family protein [Undibacterium sp.]|uniref:zeta toxin family protein n=1 Tax=Undibacterium sp. TaxID=1914977 RepID=UPI00374D2688
MPDITFDDLPKEQTKAPQGALSLNNIPKAGAAPTSADSGITFDDLPRVPITMEEVGSAAGKGLLQASAGALKALNLAGAAFPVLYDKAKNAITGSTDTDATDWAMRNMVDPAQRVVDFYEPTARERDSTVLSAVGGVAHAVGAMPQMIAASPLAGEVPAITAVTRIPEMMAGAAVHGAKTMAPTAAIDGVNRMADVNQRGGTTAQMLKAGMTSAGMTMATGGFPMAAQGNVARRLITGAGYGVVQGELQREADNLAVADAPNLQSPLTLQGVVTSGVTGGLMGAALGHGVEAPTATRAQLGYENFTPPDSPVAGAGITDVSLPQADGNSSSPGQSGAFRNSSEKLSERGQPGQTSQPAIVNEAMAAKPPDDTEKLQQESQAATVPAIEEAPVQVPANIDAANSTSQRQIEAPSGDSATATEALTPAPVAESPPKTPSIELPGQGDLRPTGLPANESAGIRESEQGDSAHTDLAKLDPAQAAHLPEVAGAAKEAQQPTNARQETGKVEWEDIPLSRSSGDGELRLPSEEPYDGSRRFNTKSEANLFRDKHKLQHSAMKDPDGGYVLAPLPIKLSEKEVFDARAALGRLNPTLEAAKLPKATFVRYPTAYDFRAAFELAKQFGARPIAISQHRGIDGVAHGGHVFLAENGEHSAIAVAGHETSHFLEKNFPDAQRRLTAFIEQYLRDGVVEARRRHENDARPIDKKTGERKGAEISYEGAHAEVIADLHGAMWLQPEFWSRMRELDSHLFRRVSYSFMETVTKGIKVLKGGHFDADRMVTDAKAVREAIAQAWAEHLQNNVQVSGEAKLEQGAQFSKKSGENPYLPTPLRETDPLLTGTIGKPGRDLLRQEIVKQAMEGAEPVTDGKPVLYIVGGGGGAGKGHVGDLLRDQGKLPEHNVVHIDADEIKQQIPEYDELVHAGDSRAADVVHEESSMLAKAILYRAMGMTQSEVPGAMAQYVPATSQGKRNIMLDATLSNFTKGIALISQAKEQGYAVHIIGVIANPGRALERAVSRDQRTGRYVDGNVIRQAHEGFLNSIDDYAKHADRFELHDNSGTAPELIAESERGRLNLSDDVRHRIEGYKNELTNENSKPGAERPYIRSEAGREPGSDRRGPEEISGAGSGEGSGLQEETGREVREKELDPTEQATPEPPGSRRKTSNNTENTERDQDKKPGPVFISALEKAIDGMPSDREGRIGVSAASMWLKGRAKEGKLFKSSELELSGLNDWLSQQKGKISVDDIREFVQQHSIKVEDEPFSRKDASAEPPLPREEPYDGSRRFNSSEEAESFREKHKLWHSVTEDKDGGYVLSPPPIKLSEKESLDSRIAVERLNALLREAEMQEIVQVRNPAGSDIEAAYYLASKLGARPIVIARHDDFSGVAYRGRIFIAETGPHPAIAVAGHETSHYLERNFPGVYKRLTSFINQFLREDAVNNRRIFEDNARSINKKTGKPIGDEISMEGAHAEVIADLHGAMWLQPEFWSRMRELDADLFRRVAYAFIETLTKSIKILDRGNFNAEHMVTDVKAVREAIAQAWAQHLQEQDQAKREHNGIGPKKEVPEPPGFRRKTGNNRENTERDQDKKPGPVFISSPEKSVDGDARNEVATQDDKPERLGEDGEPAFSRNKDNLEEEEAPASTQDIDSANKASASPKEQLDPAPLLHLADFIGKYLPVDKNGLISSEKALDWLIKLANSPSAVDIDVLLKSRLLNFLIGRNQPVHGGAIAEFIRQRISQIEENDDLHLDYPKGFTGNGTKPHSLELAKVGSNQAIFVKDSQSNTLRAICDLGESFKGDRSYAEKVAQAITRAQGKPGDHGGHIVAHRFFPDQGTINMFAQDGNFNRSAYAKMENEVNRHIENGHRVRCEIHFGQFDDKGRPAQVGFVFYVIDAGGNIIGRRSETFSNSPGQILKERE